MHKRSLCRFFLPVLLLMVGVGFCFLLWARPKGFSIRHISSPLRPSSQWESELLSAQEEERLRAILSQDFIYFGCGAQSYAFVSSDGKYVLKFFKMKHFLPKKWLSWVRVPCLEEYRFRKVERRILRQIDLFNSYKVAYEKIRVEAGLIYIHLNKTDHLNLNVKLIAHKGRSQWVSLDRFEFVVQEKAEKFSDRIHGLMQQGQEEAAAQAVAAVLKAVVEECRRGFIDCDSGVCNNYGFQGEKVIHFDLGRAIFDPVAKTPCRLQHELLRVSHKLKTWLMHHYPQLVPRLEIEIVQFLNENESSSLSLEYPPPMGL